MPKISKKFALLLVLAMLASMFVGMGAASATSNNLALTVPTVTVSAAAQTLGTIQVQETTVGSIGAGAYTEQIVVTLPSGSRFNTAPTQAATAQYVQVPALNAAGNANGLDAASLVVNNASTTSTLIINVTGRSAATPANAGLFNLLFNAAGSQVIITAGAADYKVNILDTTGGVTSGDVINGHVAVGGTSAYALAVPTRTQGNVNLGTLRIVENFAGALNNDATASNIANTITVTVPEGVTITAGAPTLAGGFVAGDVTGPVIGTSTAGLSRATYQVINRSTVLAGIIDLTLAVTIDPNCQKGDIIATVGGNNTFITPATVVLAKYGDFGITSTCADPTNIYAGRVDVKIGTPVVSENVAATLIAGRTVNLELPEGCRWVTIPTPVTTKSSLALGGGAIVVGSNNRIATYTVNNQSAGVASIVEFRQGTVAVPADFPAGDLNITYAGTAGAIADDGSKVTVKVATIVAPVTLTGATPSPTVIIGAQNQTDTTFDVIEAGVGAIAARYNAAQQNLIIETPPGVYFTAIPEISVTGDLKINTVGLRLAANDRQIIIPVTTSSATTASTINFKNAHFTLDRTVPEGVMKLRVTGGAVDQWAPTLANFNSDWTTAAQGQVANVTTPAPDQQDKTATFVVGQSKFTLEGVEITMDVAPYIKDGRTFLPIAYVAQALGIDASNIIWDAANQTVTLMKGDKVLQLKVGSNTMLVNGAAITLDAAPEINNSRTCLPVALVATAFLQTIAWDAATQTVTINPFMNRY
ncbi:MAG: copper amine oxidase N-terminal domain-containing protein [Syntrophomonas sp.]